MPIELRVAAEIRLYTTSEAANRLNRSGLRMPGGSQITYRSFMNYFKQLRKKGLNATRVGHSWVIPETELDNLTRLWRSIAE